MPLLELNGQLPVGLKAFDQYQCYNALDASVTAQLVEPMLEQANSNHLLTYNREMRLQALCLEMSSKGLPVSQMRAMELLYELRKEADRALAVLHKLCDAVWAPHLNPNSPLATANFFYEHMQFPVIYQWDYKTKQRKRGANRDALEKLRAYHPSAVPFVNAILAYREAVKLAGVFKKGLEPSGVLRCNFSPSGTETGRLSSQRNVYGRGTNAQNLNDRVRQVVEAPPGYALVYVDLKTGESYAVGYLSGDRAYIEACQSGNVHVGVAKLIWPELGWKGGVRYERALADRTFYRDFSYYDMSKRGGHATNYYGAPPTVASHLKVPKALIEAFQLSYYSAFPGIRTWQLDTIARVQRDGVLVTPLSRERRFWGRASDPATHREAIAHVPQSIIADVINEGLMQVQHWLLKEIPHVHNLPVRLGGGVRYTRAGLLAQVHDAGLFLLPQSEADAIIPELLQRLEYPVDFGPLGEMRIPAEASVGRRWSKAKFDPSSNKWKYPDGLRDWTPGGALLVDQPPRR